MSEPREPVTEAGRVPTMADLDRRVADLDARFKRAADGQGCWNCGCPAAYVRTGSEAAARADALAEIRAGVEGLRRSLVASPPFADSEDVVLGNALDAVLALLDPPR